MGVGMTLAMERLALRERDMTNPPELICPTLKNPKSEQLMRTRSKTTAKPPRMYNHADVRVLPLIWTECAWKPEVTFTRPMLAFDHVPACRIAINGGNNAMKHKKPST